MRAYEVFLNRKRLCVAGVGDGFISTYITYRSEQNDTWLDVVGLDKRKNVYAQWTRTELRNGDEVLLKVVDRRSADPYKVTRRNTEKQNISFTKRYVRAMAKKLGWEIRTKRAVK